MKNFQAIGQWIIDIFVFIITVFAFSVQSIPLIFKIVGPPVATVFLLWLVELEVRSKQREKEKAKQTGRTANKATPKTENPQTIYIRKPFDNGFEYRIEWRHGSQYVFQGHSNKYIYRIAGGKIYRGTETKVHLEIKGNKIYRAFRYDNPVYRIEGDKIYLGNFGTKPVYKISSRERG